MLVLVLLLLIARPIPIGELIHSITTEDQGHCYFKGVLTLINGQFW